MRGIISLNNQSSTIEAKYRVLPSNHTNAPRAERPQFTNMEVLVLDQVITAVQLISPQPLLKVVQATVAIIQASQCTSRFGSYSGSAYGSTCQNV